MAAHAASTHGRGVDLAKPVRRLFHARRTGGLAKPISEPALAQVFLDETQLHLRRSRLFQVWQIDAAVGFARAC